MATGSAVVPDSWMTDSPDSGMAAGRKGGRERLKSDWLVRGLGFASAALGARLLLAPRTAVERIGIGDAPGRAPGHRKAAEIAARAVGARHVAAGAGLLLHSSPAWTWGRVGGDVMDMALLGLGMRRAGRMGGTGTGIDRSRTARVAVAGAVLVGITGLDLYAAITRARRVTTLNLTSSVTVAVPALEAYELWRLLEGLPAFLAHIDEVRVTGPDTSHWRASTPFGAPVEWDAQIVEDVRGERLAWLSLAGGAVSNAGDIRFSRAPGGRGTEIHVTLHYRTSGAKAAAALTRYFGERPARRLDEELRKFKQIVETGEVVRSEGAPGGAFARREFPQHPARPLSRDELIEVLP